MLSSAFRVLGGMELSRALNVLGLLIAVLELRQKPINFR